MTVDVQMRSPIYEILIAHFLAELLYLLALSADPLIISIYPMHSEKAIYT